MSTSLHSRPLTGGPNGYPSQSPFALPDALHDVRLHLAANRLSPLSDKLVGVLRTAEHLTPREVNVVSLFVKLFNDKTVARTLGTKQQTVRNQIASAMRKLNVHSREELVALIVLANNGK